MQTNAQGGVSWLVLFIYIFKVNKSRMRWIGHARNMVKIRNAYKILVGKPEGKTLLRRNRCKWKNIKMGWSEGG